MCMNQTNSTQNISQLTADLLIKPGPTFGELAEKEETPPQVLTRFVLPFLLMGALSAFLGGLLSDAGNQLLNAMLRAATIFTINFVSLIAGGYLTYLIAPYFKTSKQLNGAFRLVFYAALPVFIAQIIGNLHSSLAFFELFGLYAFWLFWKGAPPMLQTGEKELFAFTIAANFSILLLRMILAYGFIYLFNYFRIPVV